VLPPALVIFFFFSDTKRRRVHWGEGGIPSCNENHPLGECHGSRAFVSNRAVLRQLVSPLGVFNRSQEYNPEFEMLHHHSLGQITRLVVRYRHTTIRVSLR
jgi:hypothetical protein